MSLRRVWLLFHRFVIDSNDNERAEFIKVQQLTVGAEHKLMSFWGSDVLNVAIGWLLPG